MKVEKIPLETGRERELRKLHGGWKITNPWIERSSEGMIQPYINQ